MKSEFDLALTQVCNDRGLSKDIVLEAIEMAIVSAYKRDFGSGQDISVKLDNRSGEWRVFARKQVVDEVTDDLLQMSIEEARRLKPDAAIGEVLAIELTPGNFGRIAAQTAKQVILQRIREAERDTLYVEYSGREGEIINGTIQNVDPRSGAVTIYLGKVGALLPVSEQVRSERYRFNQRLRVYVLQVDKTSRGPQVIVSRTHSGLLRRLMELEVPEIFNGTVEIKAIAREAGSRSKVAVAAAQPGVDPVGSCVGMRGVRIQHIVNELNGEKIDVVAWAQDEASFIGNALSPAKAVNVMLRPASQTAIVVVPDRQLSLAIGKEGQNARLAAKLTGWRIDIKSETEAAEEAVELAAEEAAAAALAAEKAAAQAAAKALLAEAEAALALDEEQPAVELAAEAASELEESVTESEAAPEEAAEAIEAELAAEGAEVIEPVPGEAPVLEAVAEELAEVAAAAETLLVQVPEVEITVEKEPSEVEEVTEEAFAELPAVAEVVEAEEEVEGEPVAPVEPSEEWYVEEIEEEEEEEDLLEEARSRGKKVKKKGTRSVTRARRKPGTGRGKQRAQDWLEYDEDEY